jgi:hypothetical protein
MLIVLRAALTAKRGLDDVPTVKDPNIEELPCEEKPPDPTVNDVLATIVPLEKMSLRTERLPASSECMIAEVDSRPPKSKMERELELWLLTYR